MMSLISSVAVTISLGEPVIWRTWSMWGSAKFLGVKWLIAPPPHLPSHVVRVCGNIAVLFMMLEFASSFCPFYPRWQRT